MTAEVPRGRHLQKVNSSSSQVQHRRTHDETAYLSSAQSLTTLQRTSRGRMSVLHWVATMSAHQRKGIHLNSTMIQLHTLITGSLRHTTATTTTITTPNKAVGDNPHPMTTSTSASSSLFLGEALYTYALRDHRPCPAGAITAVKHLYTYTSCRHGPTRPNGCAHETFHDLL